ncbi:MAG: hypothetical protein HY664_05390 [Chloroflexi bacterium]|nr:hypothetical protein [Chloroflexota bacterium]
MVVSPRARLFLLALGGLALITGLWGGLIRIGWDLPTLRPTFSIAHGPLVVSGFLGTVIGLERAVALQRPWTYLPPLFSGFGAIVLLLSPSGEAGPVLMVLSGLGMVAVFVVIMRIRPTIFALIMGLGAVAWLVGSALWLIDRPLYRVAPWWGGFLVLTIAAERLELGTLLRLSRVARGAFMVAAGVFILGMVGSLANFDFGMRLLGVGMVGLSSWLVNYDMARRTLKHPGLPHFIAIALLLGYFWLGLSGILAGLFGGIIVGPRYDAILHALFLGFVISMIFGHAPIIFPTVLNRTMSFNLSFYVPLIILHLSLVLRMAGDLLESASGRQWGGLLNVLAIILFMVNTMRVIRPSAEVQRGGGVSKP